jgi:hypothetical protein
MGLERGPLSLVSTTEELLGRKSSGSGLEIREYGRRDPSRWPRDKLYPQKLALTSLTSGGRSVGIVRARTQATEFSFGFFQGGLSTGFSRYNLRCGNFKPFPAFTPFRPELVSTQPLYAMVPGEGLFRLKLNSVAWVRERTAPTATLSPPHILRRGNLVFAYATSHINGSLACTAPGYALEFESR